MANQADLPLDKQWEQISRAAIPKALEITAQTTATMAQEFIPIKSGDLRRSQEIEVYENGVELNYGENLPYAKRQYYGPVNHLADSQGRPGRMVNYLSGSSRNDSEANYAKAYEEAKAANALTLFQQGGANDPRWIHRVILSKKKSKTLSKVFVNALKGT